MRYTGRVFRPPSEAYSLIVQATIGCSHNKCTFCEMYKEKQFKLRPLKEVKEDFDIARHTYKTIERIFLADGDALIRKMDDLEEILKHIKKVIPECERITCYGSPQSIKLKSLEDLKRLKELGLSMIYLGLESGSDKILKKVNKGETSEEIVNAGIKIKKAGIKVSVTAISGLGGKELWEEHAIQTGKALSKMKPDYIGLLTLMLEGGTPMQRDYQNGKFKPLNAREVAKETHLLLENLDSEGSVFRSNHASNYLTLKGDLNKDKEKMMNQLKSAIDGKTGFKGESFRAL